MISPIWQIERETLNKELIESFQPDLSSKSVSLFNDELNDDPLSSYNGSDSDPS